MQDHSLDWLFIVLGLVFGAILIGVVADFVHHFAKELRFLNMEISRTHGKERKVWEKRRRRLWLSLIPFFKY
jgi:hypothetical protein